MCMKKQIQMDNTNAYTYPYYLMSQVEGTTTSKRPNPASTTAPWVDMYNANFPTLCQFSYYT